MTKNKLLILFVLRVLIFGLFMMSGILKLFPSIVPFEKQLVDLGFVDWCSAPYLARFIIALELGLGFAFLFSHYLKKIIIPVTALLLVAFCVHLSYIMYTQGANSGNCGCFGQLIPMTPLQAFIKNIVTLGALGYMYYIYKEKPKSSIRVLLLIFSGATLLMFILFPFCPCNAQPVIDETDVVVTLPEDTSLVLSDTLTKDSIVLSQITGTEIGKKIKTTIGKDTASKTVQKEVKSVGPAKKVSAYAAFKKFSGNTIADLDNGKKIVTLFSLECEHCMETAKQIGALNKTRNLPETYFLFWGTEDQVENFFEVAQCRYPYKIIDPSTFFQLLGNAPSPPKVSYIVNGNIISEFDSNSFSIEKLEETIDK